jgi:formyltetrahydrofolate-dependent phosphoribosylglycinamide formyltransferase
VVAVISNRADAYGLERARTAGVPAIVQPKYANQNRRQYDTDLAERVAAYQPDWIVLAGWLRVLSSNFLHRFPERVVNLHPALPGAFPGLHAIERAYRAYHLGQINHTGLMVHLVPDEGVDCGPVLAQDVVPIFSDDTLTALETRMHQSEHKLLITTLRSLCST